MGALGSRSPSLAGNLPASYPPLCPGAGEKARTAWLPTGFANSEEDYAAEFVGQRIQPFRIEDEAKELDGANFIVNSRFKAHAVRDGNLITGQQQYSGREAAKLVIGALGA